MSDANEYDDYVLTPAEEEGIRLALEEADRGEGMSIDEFREQIRAEL